MAIEFLAREDLIEAHRKIHALINDQAERENSRKKHLEAKRQLPGEIHNKSPGEEVAAKTSGEASIQLE